MPAPAKRSSRQKCVKESEKFEKGGIKGLHRSQKKARQVAHAAPAVEKGGPEGWGDDEDKLLATTVETSAREHPCRCCERRVSHTFKES